uniref:P2X purinoceptor n=1 Tax=Otolemur garnettii TaxID=30611 RepID=H0XN94_OTOGA
MGQVGWKGLCLSLFDYKTEKYVVAKNKKVGLLYRLVQLIILAYLVIWVFVIKKGYQDVDTSLQSAVVTKVKGVAFTNSSELGERLWDVADYVIPSQGENVFFVITNLIVTPNQRQKTCAEREDIPDGMCSNDSDCHPGETVTAGHGEGLEWPGPEWGAKGDLEEIKSKPVEPFLKKAEDFTIYIKNFVRFPKFNFSRNNVMNIKKKSFLKSCRFDPKNPYCPIFHLGSIIRWAGSTFHEIALEGGVIGIHIEWNCDLDKAASECKPHYSFSRLDNKLSKSVSSGFNFRSLPAVPGWPRSWAGVQWEDPGPVGNVGYRYQMIVNGKAGKFNIIPTVINVGSGLALMGVAAFICDLVLIYLLKKSGFYRNKKYEEVR